MHLNWHMKHFTFEVKDGYKKLLKGFFCWT
jgi:hypothetical protein